MDSLDIILSQLKHYLYDILELGVQSYLVKASNAQKFYYKYPVYMYMEKQNHYVKNLTPCM